MSAEPNHRAADDFHGVSFEGFTALTPIYEGAETLVFRGKRIADGARVVLKQTKNEYPTVREVGRLRREFTILRELGVDSAPEAIALEEHGRGVVLIMADLGHPTLREILESRRLDIETSLTIALSISNALAAVHRKGIIHKDVTPRNVLIEESSWTAHLIDFGISARLSRELHAPTGPRSLEGTLLYMAPEQTGRMNRAVDSRADLYSLGVILYEMLTGSVPFPQRELSEIVQSHLTRPPVPPCELVPAVPAPLSDLVMMLLAKTPEERYQSDAGVRADLSECLRQWKTNGTIATFPLRQRDKAPELRRAQRLYGRERDLEALLQAFGRARARGPELCLVAGYSGVGKSALVREIHKIIARHGGGYFASGKFDQISRDVPLAPVVHALRELVQQILTEPPETLAAYKSELLTALGGNGAILIELVPELELVLGAQPKVSDLPPDQAKNRFELTLQNFLHVFASEKHPLVIFLDDLQWMDPASQRLMHLLLTDTWSRHLLIIGAYRDNEVSAGHPLSNLLAELESSGFQPAKIHLAPLDREMVGSLVADTLTSEPQEVRTLADLVHEKTQGNPFFAHQFMVALYERGLLRFDPESGAWQWDDAAIRAANVTDNVVDLMVGVLRRLSPETQHVLERAACIGHSFDFGSLATIAEKPVHEVSAALWEALRAGLVVSLDGDYRYLESGVGSEAREVSSSLFNVRYQFVHDRVLSAAYMLVEPEQRKQLHLSIGRLLRKRSGERPRDEDLLDLVHHLNLGASAITDRAERRDLAEINLRAGQKAKAATAYHAGAIYTRAGIELLDAADWDEHYDLCHSLHIEGGQCAFACGDAERAEALFAEALRHARTDLERAEIQRQRIYKHASYGEFLEALRVGSETLAMLGHELTLDEMNSPEVMVAELSQITPNLRGRPIWSLVDEPEATDPVMRAILSILDAIADSGHYVSAIAFSVINFRAVNLSLVHGPTELCPFPYACAGYVLAGMFGRVTEGLAFCEVAGAINQRFPSVMQLSRLHVAWGSGTHMQHPMRDAIKSWTIARQKGLESGEFAMLGTACFLETMGNVFAGDPIEELLQEADKNLAIVRRTKNSLNLATMTVVRQTVACLAGKTRERTSLDDDTFNEKEYLDRLEGEHFGNTRAHHAILKVLVYLIYGRYEDAWKASEVAEHWISHTGGNLASKVHPCLRALVLLGLPRAEAPEEAERRAEILRKCRAEVTQLAAWSPKSFAHFDAMVNAEAARTEGNLEGAVRLYERAITLCQENKAPHLEALTGELCAKFYLSIGAPTAGGGYMKNAYRAYKHWGATPKIDALENEATHIWPSLRDVSRTRGAATTTGSSASLATRTLIGQTSIGSLRDAALVVRAAQEIASEIDLPKVIDRLAKLVLENAGADQGSLILARGGALVVEATFQPAGCSLDVGRGQPLEAVQDCAKSVVHYVTRTLEPVVLDNSRKATRFSDDPYIQEFAPKSILCLPLLHQGRLSGALYLENRMTAGVFDAARVELLALLSSQAAIAIEIARLIENAHAANEQVKRANERLEMEVAHRTEELRRVNDSLFDMNRALEQELGQRRQIEQERAALHEQVIAGQRQRLAELSTPLLPITKDIVVMPLIGTMDTERAELVLSVALDGAQRLGARVVILDVTGMKHVDTQVAGMLVNVAAALRLLGAETVLTGIAPRIAQTLVALDVDLKSFVTMGTLQSGMEYALRRSRHVDASPAPRRGGPQHR
ncbi:AAA family ATPase [Polyangium sp. 15x6]|uniref:AAA family ATPase n=1 Tax=Polyangium sp. 15x6 TaxID=3042687 RepID=UPI00249A43AB|nr:AAA family ATPase [Polyangium sp. 15x6]MDI3281884.1 AAA family ATPase [Polyangium sp. 15x6]